ncbi:MAG: hypothetical protein ACYC91_15335 [Solirubrobacteraceae bacterium]
MSGFRSAQEFHEVLDRTFTIMSDAPEMGPRLRAADTPRRFGFPDLDLVVNIPLRGAGAKPGVEVVRRGGLGPSRADDDELGDRQPVFPGLYTAPSH